ncbi:MAG: polysaccharide deacetylase family protein [Desulfovibrio sp.]|nr:polysaccharide deacetylase family protein [Desulfovibrio sp.]
MKKSGTQSLPVLMYHYVNAWSGAITISPERFEEHCRALAAKGRRGVSLAEAEAYFIYGEALPEKSVLLTFDDGFLDNYLYALPILHKYGHQATIFAVSARLGQNSACSFAPSYKQNPGSGLGPDKIRMPIAALKAGEKPDFPQVLNPYEERAGAVLRSDVFLNPAEIKALDEDGTLNPASHGRGHYGVFTGPEYKEAFLPDNLYRTFFHTEIGPIFGLPDFKVGPGLMHRAFLPDPDFVEAIKSLVPQNFQEMRSFARNPAALQDLQALYAVFADRIGRLESDSEREQRMWREIAGGREDLEKILGRKVISLCWPWGHYCREALDLARQAGFEVLFTTKEGVNPPGQALAVHRFKAKDKGATWLNSRAFIYSSPFLGALYTKLRI